MLFRVYIVGSFRLVGRRPRTQWYLQTEVDGRRRDELIVTDICINRLTFAKIQNVAVYSLRDTQV